MSMASAQAKSARSMEVSAGLEYRTPASSTISFGGIRRRLKVNPRTGGTAPGVAISIDGIGAAGQKNARAAAPVSTTASGWRRVAARTMIDGSLASSGRT